MTATGFALQSRPSERNLVRMKTFFFVLIRQLPFFSWDYIGVRLGVAFRVGIRVMIKISF